MGPLDTCTYSLVLVGTCLPRVLRPFNVQFQPTPGTHTPVTTSTTLSVPIWKTLDARNASQTIIDLIFNWEEFRRDRYLVLPFLRASFMRMGFGYKGAISVCLDAYAEER